MLTITENVLECIKKATEYSSVEQGFVLGCTSRLDRIDICDQISATQAGMYFYSPDTEVATKVIDRWLKDDICFCGFIHSHRTNKKFFSEPDIRFAEKLLKSFRMPYLWFGLLVIAEQKEDMLFCKLCFAEDEIILKPIKFYIEEKKKCGQLY